MLKSVRRLCGVGWFIFAPIWLNAQSDAQLLYDQIRRIRLPEPPAVSATRSFLESGNDKIDPGLRLLANQGQTRSLGGFDQAAKALQIPVSGGLVAVSAAVEAGESVATVRRRVEDAGGEVDAIVGDSVLARIPARAIETIGADRSVGYLARQGISYATATTTYGGVELSKVSALHKKGIRGRGIKVGVLDFGFGGYHDLESKGVVPTPIAARFFGESKDWAVGVPHGAACTEIIHAMAPEAQIYVAMVGDGSGTGNDGEIVAAAQWLVSQKVDIISFSGGGHGGPHDGRAMLNQLVDAVTGQGVLWVNAAGNEGDSHWSGPAKDADHDGWIDLGPKGEPFLIIQPKVDAAVVLVTWNDWGPDPSKPSSDQDLNAYLFSYDPNTQKAELVAKSENPQNGRGAPQEFIGVKTQAGKIFLLALHVEHVTHDFRIHVFSMVPADIVPANKQGSIGIPATSAAALSVAAIDVTTGKLETYSSQGPTDDDRIKPDVAGPDNDVSVAYSKRFQGTSAACPHVSGMAALLKQMNPKADVASLRQVVVNTTRKLSTTVPNNETGFGIIDAGAIDGTAPPAQNPGAKGRTKIPKNFGGEISISALERLRSQAGAASRINPKVVVGKPVYKVGDGLKIGFKVDQDCYFILFHRSVDGEYTVLSPARDGAAMLRAGEDYIEPSGENRTLRITPPAGTEEILLICSPRETDLNDWREGDGSVAIASTSYRVSEE